MTAPTSIQQTALDALTSRAALLRQYVEEGWALVPLPRQSKSPGRKGWERVRLTMPDVVAKLAPTDANVGVLLGQASGELVDVDLDCDEAVAAAPTYLPPTTRRHGRAGRPNSHWWYVADAPGAQSCRYLDSDNRSLVELRANKRDGTSGLQTVIPPSLHQETGERIEWVECGPPARIAIADLRTAVGRVAATALLARRWTPGGRNALLLPLAGVLARRWEADEAWRFIALVGRIAGDRGIGARRASVEATAAKLRAGAATTGLPTLTQILGAAVVDKLVEWLGLSESPLVVGASSIRDGDVDPLTGEPYHLTDLGLACRFAAAAEGAVLHCATLGGWHVYDGGAWRAGDVGGVHDRLHAVVRALFASLAALPSGDDKKRLTAYALKCESERALTAAVKLAAHDRRLRADAGAFDADPWRFNVLNGTLDLRDPDRRTSIADLLPSRLLPHDPSDRLRQQAPIAFDPFATAPRFDAFLARIFRGRPALVTWLQRFVGYCLTGLTTEQQFYVWWGTGSNGKSTLINILHALLGTYARSAAYETFLKARAPRGGEAPRPDLVRLAGARFVAALENHGRLDEGLLKQLTGGDAIDARALYASAITFRPQCKLVLCANERPTVGGRDHAIWRRVCLVPFIERITTEEIAASRRATGADFIDTIVPTELPGILRWAVEGCLMWQRAGLALPEDVAAATAEYAQSQDTLAPFFEDECVEGADRVVEAGVLYMNYRDWAIASGQGVLSNRHFGEQLRARGYEPTKHRQVRAWRGLELRARKLGPPR